MVGITYSGRNRRGTYVGGRLRPDQFDGFVESKFRARWQHLAVYTEAHSGKIGEITRHPDTGKRIWWSDTEAPSAVLAEVA